MSKKQTPKAAKKTPTQKTKTAAPKAPKTKAHAPAVETKTTTGKVTTQDPTPESKGMAPTSTSDPRLPAVGTVIQKRDRHGAIRCECTVEEGGIRYAGTLYRSISSAALAAAKDLGLRNKSENGYVFWGLVKLHRPGTDPVAAFKGAWERYLERAEALVRIGITEESREEVAAEVGKHAAMIAKLEERIGLAQE
jgi:hypothetical protein